MSVPNEINEISIQVGDWDESVGLRPNFLTIKDDNNNYLFDFENTDSQEYRKSEIEYRRKILEDCLSSVFSEDITVKYDFELKAEFDADIQYQNDIRMK